MIDNICIPIIEHVWSSHQSTESLQVKQNISFEHHTPIYKKLALENRPFTTSNTWNGYLKTDTWSF